MKIEGRVWIAKAEGNLAGHGRVDLLQKIAETGSISQAAESMGMSYKAAWESVDAMNNLAGEALVERVTGGKGGGGTLLTERGQRLVADIRTGAVNDEIVVELQGGDRIAAVITQESTRHLGLTIGTDVVALIKAPWVIVASANEKLKLSAQNRLSGTIVKLQRDAVNAEVVIQLPGGGTVCAVISNDSVDELGLCEGQAAAAIFTASHVILGVPAY